MAISIDWGTKVINVPRADMTLVQTTPIEIRELGLEILRARLRDLEDDEAGIAFPTTANYNGPVSVGGVTLAAVLEILDPYTLTFEDGQYAVNITGGNTNIADKVNINNVSVRSANSAGLVQTSEIQYSAYQNGVTIDTVRGIAGQAYPIGTVQTPVNNLDDALFIANARGFDTIYVNGTFVMPSDAVVDNIIFEGRAATKSLVSIPDTGLVTNCVFRRLTLTGFLDGGSDASDCVIGDVDYIDGAILDCLMVGTVTLSGQQANFLRCASGVAGGGAGQAAAIDLNGGGTDLVVRDYQGGLLLLNDSTSGDAVSIDMSSGRVIFDSTITAGTFYVRGIAEIEDNSTGTAVIDDQTLQGVMPTPVQISSQIQTDSQSTPVHANVKQMNDATVLGDGTINDKWRGA